METFDLSPIKILEEDKAAHPESYLPQTQGLGFEILYDGHIIGGVPQAPAH